MAIRYCGRVKIKIEHSGLVNGRDIYKGYVKFGRIIFRFDDLGSPVGGVSEAGKHIASDSPRAYDIMTQSALSFASHYEGEEAKEGFLSESDATTISEALDTLPDEHDTIYNVVRRNPDAPEPDKSIPRYSVAKALRLVCDSGHIRVYKHPAFTSRVRRIYRNNLSNPGDCKDNPLLLLALAIAEADIGKGQGWIPQTQKLASDMVASLEPLTK